MNNLVKIGNSDLSIKEFNGQRVVTFKDVDSVHERPDGTARKRFNDNRSRFIEGEDFYKICPSEIRTHKIMEISEMAREDVTLLTESGYLMLVKSFTDDLAWEVQRELVKTYFNKKKPMSPVEMMRIQLGMIDDHEGRITDLEQNMTLDYGQQMSLGDVVNRVVVDTLGGKDSNAYHEIGRKVFAECNRDLKHYFNVNARNNVPKKKFDEAVDYVKNWQPCTNTRIMIQDCNAQLRM